LSFPYKIFVAAFIQDGAMGIGKQNHPIRSRNSVLQKIQFVRRQMKKKQMLILAPLQLTPRQQIKAGRIRAEKT
jgi:hypothetical protein